MKATDAAMATLARIRGGDDDATKNATTTLHAAGNDATNRATTADYELAGLLGLPGSRQQFLGAVDLVAYFSNTPWPHDDALEALAAYWRRDIETLSAVGWILSAAHADEVREFSAGKGNDR